MASPVRWAPCCWAELALDFSGLGPWALCASVAASQGLHLWLFIDIPLGWCMVASEGHGLSFFVLCSGGGMLWWFDLFNACCWDQCEEISIFSEINKIFLVEMTVLRCAECLRSKGQQADYEIVLYLFIYNFLLLPISPNLKANK